MMDSQENALTQGTEEVKQADEATSVNPQSAEETAPNTAENADKVEEDYPSKKVYNTKKEVIDRLCEMANS